MNKNEVKTNFLDMAKKIKKVYKVNNSVIYKPFVKVIAGIKYTTVCEVPKNQISLF